MKEFKLTWSVVTLVQYEDILDVLKEDTDNFAKSSKIAKILFGVELEDVPITEMGKYINDVQNLLNTPINKSNPKKVYKIGSNKYRMTKLSEMTAAQFMDYHELAKNVEDNINRICGTFLIPEGHKYNDGYDIDEVYDDMWNLPIEDVTGIAFFQVGLLKKQLKRTQAFSIAQILMNKNLKWENKKSLIKGLNQAYKGMDYLIS